MQLMMGALHALLILAARKPPLNYVNELESYVMMFYIMIQTTTRMTASNYSHNVYRLAESHQHHLWYLALLWNGTLK